VKNFRANEVFDYNNNDGERDSRARDVGVRHGSFRGCFHHFRLLYRSSDANSRRYGIMSRERIVTYFCVLIDTLAGIFILSRIV